MGIDERDDPGAYGSVVFPVAPVAARRVVPRSLLVALVVGGLAFFAGLQVGAWGSADRTRSSVTPPVPSPSAAAIVVTPSATAAPESLATDPPAPAPSTPGSSDFVRGFRPPDLIAGVPGATGCTTTPGQLEVPRTRRDGPRMTFIRSWMTWCPIPDGERQSFVLGVIDAIVGRAPESTYGFSTAATGSATALLPYAEGPYAGTVTLSADAAGTGLAIAVVLEERLAQ
jgi:hypothetical protein